MKTQEEVFNSIPALARELKGLARYIQNDLDYMIRNADTNLESLKEHKAMFIEDVKSFADDLTVEESFIGLLQKRGAGIAKSVWTKSGYAKSAFKEHTGVYFGEQDRYIIKEIRC